MDPIGVVRTNMLDLVDAMTKYVMVALVVIEMLLAIIIIGFCLYVIGFLLWHCVKGVWLWARDRWL